MSQLLVGETVGACGEVVRELRLPVAREHRLGCRRMVQLCQLVLDGDALGHEALQPRDRALEVATTLERIRQGDARVGVAGSEFERTAGQLLGSIHFASRQHLTRGQPARGREGRGEERQPGIGAHGFFQHPQPALGCARRDDREHALGSHQLRTTPEDRHRSVVLVRRGLQATELGIDLHRRRRRSWIPGPAITRRLERSHRFEHVALQGREPRAQARAFDSETRLDLLDQDPGPLEVRVLDRLAEGERARVLRARDRLDPRGNVGRPVAAASGQADETGQEARTGDRHRGGIVTPTSP